MPLSGRVKEVKRKGQAAQGKEKEKEKVIAPVSSLSSLPLPILIDHVDGTDRSVLFVCVVFFLPVNVFVLFRGESNHFFVSVI